MTAIDFPQSNKTYVSPEGMEDRCHELHVWQGTLQGDPVIVSCWQPTEDEIARILVGEPVFLLVVGQGTPPVSVIAGHQNAELFFQNP